MIRLEKRIYTDMSNNTKRQAHRYTDSTKSFDRIISFSSPSSAGSLQHLSPEEKDCLRFLDESIESTLTEDGDLSGDDSQTSGNTISTTHQRTTREVPPDVSSCSSFAVTGSSQDLSAEEKDCLKFLEETIDSMEDSGLSDKDKLEVLSKLGLLKKDVTPQNKQGLDAPLSSSFPDCPQKHQLEKSLVDDDRSALRKLSHDLTLSLLMVPDVDDDQRWALRKLGVLKD